MVKIRSETNLAWYAFELNELGPAANRHCHRDRRESPCCRHFTAVKFPLVVQSGMDTIS